MAFVTGIISTWSSTSGVVLPAFLPTVPGVLARLGGGDPLALSLSINVGSSLVDVSPLSTLGALCVAAVEDPETARVALPPAHGLGAVDDASSGPCSASCSRAAWRGFEPEPRRKGWGCKS